MRKLLLKKLVAYALPRVLDLFLEVVGDNPELLDKEDCARYARGLDDEMLSKLGTAAVEAENMYSRISVACNDEFWRRRGGFKPEDLT